MTFDSKKISAHFGVQSSEEDYSYLLLQGKIKLFCSQGKVVMVSDGGRSYAQIPVNLWDFVSATPSAHLLTTRSGEIAMQLSSSHSDLDESDWCVEVIRQIIDVFAGLK